MWFAKWFGGRSDRDDEPARFAPPVAPKSVTPAKRTQGNAGGQPNTANGQSKSGFDPYNSGSYDRNRAWERVLR